MHQIESRDTETERDLHHIEFRDSGTVPELTGILVPRCRDFSTETVPQIFVPVSTVPWLCVPVPEICGTGPGIPNKSWDTRPFLRILIYENSIITWKWIAVLNLQLRRCLEFPVCRYQYRYQYSARRRSFCRNVFEFGACPPANLHFHVWISWLKGNSTRNYLHFSKLFTFSNIIYSGHIPYSSTVRMHRYDPSDPRTKLLGFKFDQN